MKFNYDQYLSYTPILSGIFALLYAYYFVVAKNPFYYSLFLLLLGLTSLKVIVLLYGRLKNVDENLSRMAVIFGLIGATGMAVHGGYDFANVINPPRTVLLDLPNQVDPRGLLSFGFLGLGIFKISWLMYKSKSYAKGLAELGCLFGILLIVIYLARLTVLNPANPILLYPVLINGFVVGPLWYLWLGYEFLKKG